MTTIPDLTMQEPPVELLEEDDLKRNDGHGFWLSRWMEGA